MQYGVHNIIFMQQGTKSYAFYPLTHASVLNVHNVDNMYC
jgi:hypothetical protein